MDGHASRPIVARAGRGRTRLNRLGAVCSPTSSATGAAPARSTATSPTTLRLLAAFNVTDRGSLTREINRRLGMPPGIGVEFYAQPLEDGDWDTWIGAGGQGDGFNFPTSIADTLECAREAFDDYVGDHYRDLKFDKDWYPPETTDRGRDRAEQTSRTSISAELVEAVRDRLFH